MSGFLQGRTTKENIALKRFGYVLSAILIIATVILMKLESPFSGLLFIILMYVLGGALWMPFLIKPLYNLFGKKLFPSEKMDASSPEKKSHESTETDR